MFENTRLFAESWNVAYRKKEEGLLLERSDQAFIVIENPGRYWAADPFLFEDNGQVYIFAELYDYILHRGVIGYCEISSRIKPKWKPIIVEDYHLSFPYIYKEGTDIFIMPESSAAKCLYRYRAVRFPDKWERDTVLRSNVRYVDTVLINSNGHRGALTYNIENDDKPALHYLDFANSKNDYVITADKEERYRPAGKLLEDRKLRCAQNCSEDYGKGLIFYQYTFDGGKYKETEIKRIFPTEVKLSRKIFLDGMHTYNYSEQYEVIDIKTRRFNLLNLSVRTVRKLMKRINR